MVRGGLSSWQYCRNRKRPDGTLNCGKMPLSVRQAIYEHRGRDLPAEIKSKYMARMNATDIDDAIADKEKLIEEKQKLILRQQAIYELKTEGKLPEDYK